MTRGRALDDLAPHPSLPAGRSAAATTPTASADVELTGRRARGDATSTRPRGSDVVLVHDYLTQRGGAERVVLSMLRAFEGAPLYTSLYRPETTFPEFVHHDVRTLPVNALAPFRKHHRAALPLLAPSFSQCRIDAALTLVSSSGWAHGVRADGRKVVYCHSVARWLYQSDRYLRTAGWPARAGLALLRRPLLSWDRAAAGTADLYLTQSTAMRQRIRAAYGIDAVILPAPHSIDVLGPQRRVAGLEPGFVLCVSRLLPYKNVDAVIEAVGRIPDARLVVVGTGPERRRLQSIASPRVHLVGAVGDDELRWLYQHCSGLVAASYEDYGLTPLEAAAFARPVAALRWGGYMDTVVEGETGVFFDRPDPQSIIPAVRTMRSTGWDPERLRAHANAYTEPAFVRRLRALTAG